MDQLVVTNHASDRIKERVGVSKKIAGEIAQRAFDNGVTHAETSGSLSRYLDHLFLQYEKANNVRIYCGNVYIFINNVLVTTFPLPPKYRKTATKLQQKKGAKA